MDDEPNPRFNHILAPVGYKSFLLAGETDLLEEENERDEIASSLCIFNHETKKWTYRQISMDNKPPGLRYGGYVSHGNLIYSFGGRHDTGIERYHTLHKFDTGKHRWNAFPPFVNPQAELPMPKAGCVPVIIDDKFCLFGGYGTLLGPLQPGSEYHHEDEVYKKGHTNEFHIFDLKKDAMPYWKSIKVDGDRPPPCSYYTMNLVDSKTAVMFGGNTKHGRTNDVYIMTLDGTTKVTFRKIRKYGEWPKKRSSHAGCVLNYDDEFPQLLVTGGLDENTKPLRDLWLLSIKHETWKKIEDKDFLERWQPAVSCVRLNERISSVLLFGGVNKSGRKLAYTTILEFYQIKEDGGGGAEQWRMERSLVLGNDSAQSPEHGSDSATTVYETPVQENGTH